MTLIRLHGILAKEYGNTFCFAVGNPRNVLEAIDCNRSGFKSRLIELHQEGFSYDIIIDKKRISEKNEMDNMCDPETIDLVPAISGSGPIVGAIFSLLGGTGFWATVAKAVLFAAISYALTPKPDQQQVEITAKAGKESLIFSNRANVASQGAPVPLGYGRLKVGSQVVQATIKSFPQSQKTRDALNPHQENIAGEALNTNKVSDRFNLNVS